MELIALLIFSPIIAAPFMIASRSRTSQYFVATVTFLIGSLLSVSLFLTPPFLHVYSFSFALERALLIADLLLLLFFVYQGYRFKDKKVAGLALLQLLLYGLAEAASGGSGGTSLLVDKLSTVMFLIINVVGGIIVLYAVWYMRDEAMSSLKKRLFVVYLLLFLSVMNTLVVANSLLLFFFLFEMTTLASYLLIAFRDDIVSRTNALRALWMNQVGGVLILLALLIAVMQLGTVYIDVLMSRSGGYLLFAVSLLSMAAFVKGAAMPFDSWLLGAMVAPTPVSAMLHSATMVKIAPFVILKFAPLLAGTLLGGTIAVSGALVFVAASYFALSKEIFKEILGYSTIALLGLMMSMAALGTQAGEQIAMVLIVFHALSKALLFLAAGVLEKVHHLKSIESMKGLTERAPKSVAFIIFGFMTLVLPPFGLFMGKLFALQAISENLMRSPWQVIVLLGVVVGSVLLTLLYFKVASALLSKGSDVDIGQEEKLPVTAVLPLAVLTLLILSASLWLFAVQSTLSLFYLLVPALLLGVIVWLSRRLGRFDRTAVYHCGEKESFDAALFYYDMGASTRRGVYWFFGLLFAGVALAGALS
jgi:ech hydrogenase subunit A